MDSKHDKGRTFPDAKILNFPERTMSERKKDVSFVRFRQKPAIGNFAIPPQLSNVFRILTPKNGGCRQQKGNSTEKTPIFEVFRKVLIDKLLHDYLSVNVRFTKSKFARGKVSLRERYRFVV